MSKQAEELPVHKQAAMAHSGLAGTSTRLQPSFASTLPLVRQPGLPHALTVTGYSRHREESPKYKNKHFVDLSGLKIPLLNSMGSS